MKLLQLLGFTQELIFVTVTGPNLVLYVFWIALAFLMNQQEYSVTVLKHLVEVAFY